MWPTQFDYARASSVDEALEQINSDDAKFLAGGHSLLPVMKLRLAAPEKLVDIGRLEALKGISANGSLSIGATSTHAEIAASSDVQSMCSALASAAGQIGDQQVRNFGTLGGNIAHADPASDPPTVLLAADATIHIKSSSGERSVGAADFFVDLFATDLGEDELITSISIPDHSGHKMAYAKFAHPASRYAIVGICVALEMDGDSCKSAKVAIGGATVKALRSSGAEAALSGSSLDDAAIKAAADALKSDIEEYLTGDVSYPAEYRAQMAGVYLKRAIDSALG
ncbi:MAG: FAD binding domain-containing protein [Aggregatilineales bacterium]